MFVENCCSAGRGSLTVCVRHRTKKALDWVKATCPAVHWQDVARWVQDDKYYTASGVTAGIDMALGFIADRYDRCTAERIARGMEYVWHDNPALDPFARVPHESDF